MASIGQHIPLNKLRPLHPAPTRKRKRTRVDDADRLSSPHLVVEASWSVSISLSNPESSSQQVAKIIEMLAVQVCNMPSRLPMQSDRPNDGLNENYAYRCPSFPFLPSLPSYYFTVLPRMDAAPQIDGATPHPCIHVLSVPASRNRIGAGWGGVPSPLGSPSGSVSWTRWRLALGPQVKFPRAAGSRSTVIVEFLSYRGG
ncbi:hypothetical protein LZ32DRAFT_12980 [Colletotrichum eremochloae]|nr:hypothetical protein LZ32DRAFT_12980 [Colletotrichum eremochloae]